MMTPMRNNHVLHEYGVIVNVALLKLHVSTSAHVVTERRLYRATKLPVYLFATL